MPRMHGCNLRYGAFLLIAATIFLSVLDACKSGSDLKLVREVDPRYGPHVVHVGHRDKASNKQGTWISYMGERRDQLTTWKDGVKHGVNLSWGADGLLLSDAFYIKGKQEGRTRGFGGDDNRLTWLSWWQRGVPHGFWCEWSDDGVLLEIVEYYEGRHIRTEERPGWPCPYTEGELGKHHFDPADRSYEAPYRKTQRRRRSIRTID